MSLAIWMAAGRQDASEYGFADEHRPAQLDTEATSGAGHHYHRLKRIMNCGLSAVILATQSQLHVSVTVSVTV